MERARSAAESGDWDPAVELMRDALAAAGSGAPASLRANLAAALANRGVAAAESALKRVELRSPDPDEVQDELARRARRVLSASLDELPQIVARYPAAPRPATPPKVPWWRRRLRVTLRGTLAVVGVLVVVVLVFTSKIAATVFVAVALLVWLVGWVLGAVDWLSERFRSLPDPTRQSYEYRAPEIHCEGAGCTWSATTQVDLEQHTGDRELRSKYLCAVHAAALESVLRAPVVAGAGADRSTIVLLRAAESDLEEAAALDPSLPGIEESLSQVKIALVRVDERPRPRPTAQAPAPPPARDVPRGDGGPPERRASPRRARRKKRRR